MTQDKIAVLGAGSNGASIGADLTAAGLDVTLIEQWPAHVEAMREKGVRIEMPDSTLVQDVRVLNLCEVAELKDRFDVVLMLLKAYDTKWGSEFIAPHLTSDGVLVGVQNGMTVDTIAGVVGSDRTLGCVIEISSMMFDPGIIQRHSGPDRSWFALGNIDPAAQPFEQPVASLLSHSGTVELVDNIRAAKWMKLVSNCTTLVTTAILGMPILEASEIPGMRELMLRSGEEALRAGIAQGFPVLPIYGLEPDDVSQPDTVVEVLLDTLLEGFVLPNTKTTILQDWMKSRRSEANDLNGHVVEVSYKFGLDCPVNASVIEIARRIERAELEPIPDNANVLLEMAG